MSDKLGNKYQISLYASGLKNVAGFGKGTSDPYAVVTLLAGSDDERAQIIGRTEVVKNELSPSWTTTFVIRHCFGKDTRINVGIFDEVRKSKGNKSMGSAQFEIGEILGSKGNVRAKRLKPGGTLFVRVARASDLDLGTFHLALQGQKLKNMDGMFGKSDPFFVVETFAKGAHGGRQWLPVYRSEHVMNNLNPAWKECDIPVEKLCSGDKEQPIQISVYDWEKNGKHQSMGKCQTSTNGLIAAGMVQTPFDLIMKGKSYGKLVITRAEITGIEMNPDKPPPKFASVGGIRQINPDYKKWQAKYGRGGQGVSLTSGSGHYSMSSGSGDFSMNSDSGQVDTPPRSSNSRHRSSGSKSSSRSDGKSSSRSDGKSSSSRSDRHRSSGSDRGSRSDKSRRDRSPKPPSSSHRGSGSQPSSSSNYDASGSMVDASSGGYGAYNMSESSLPPAIVPEMTGLTISEPVATAVPSKPTFIDYLSGGTEINLSVAIDFTGSNGDPRKEGTLHYIHRDGQFNDYEKALTAVASIVARYDHDQMFPVYGFGAKFGGDIQHCFQVGKSTELKGIAGMLEGYRDVFKTGLTMSGPTVFAEVILQAAVQAQSKQEVYAASGKQSYSILLILTDGDVADIEETRQAIRYASSAPLSIVIVGVGYEDFSKMQFLDDFHLEDDDTRDIVQFVEFNKHRDNRQRLTQETLDEIPDQLVDYFLGQGIQPLPPIENRQSILPDDFNERRDIDLDIQEDSNGDLELRNSSMARYDTKSYGTTAGFLGGEPILAGVPVPDQAPVNLGTPYKSSSVPAASPASGNMSFAPPSGRSTSHNPTTSTPTRSGSGVPSGGYAATPPHGMPSYGGGPPMPPASYGDDFMPSYGGGQPGGSMPSYSNPPGGGGGYNPSGSYNSGGGGYNPSASYNSGGGYNPSASYNSGGGGYNPSASYNSGGGGYGNDPLPVAQSTPIVQPVTLRVKAPPNSYPGMQIRVAHPNTGQLHVVTIPNGVVPGGDFRVNLS